MAWFGQAETPEQRAQQMNRGGVLMALGQGLSQMAYGQPVNMSPAFQAIQNRQRSAQMQQALKASGVLERFTPEQRAILAQMEPGAAQKIIAQTLFAQPDQGTDDMQEYRYAQSQGYQGSFTDFMTDMRRAGATNVTTNVGPQGRQLPDPPKDSVYALDENGEVMMEQVDLGDGRVGMRPVAIPMAGTAAEQTAREIEDAQIAEIQSAEDMLSTIERMVAHPALENATGVLAWTQAVPGTAAYEFGTYAEQLQGQAFTQVYQKLKGAGDITDNESAKAEQALARLKSGLRPEDYEAALWELHEVINRGLIRARKRASTKVNELTDEELLETYK